MAKTPRHEIQKLLEELLALADASRPECFTWWAATLGTVLSLLRSAPEEFRINWEREWRSNEPDGSAIELLNVIARTEDDYPVSIDKAVQAVEDAAWSIALDLGDVWSTSEDLLEADSSFVMHLWGGGVDPGGDDEQSKTDMLCGTRYWGMPGTRPTYVRFRWMSTCWELLMAALAQLSANAINGSATQAVELSADSAPPFDKVCAGMPNAKELAQSMRFRWRAAECLRVHRFYAEACIFYGSLVEAVLVSYLEQVLPEEQRETGGKPVNRWSFKELFEAAKKHNISYPILDNISKQIWRFRNSVHINSKNLEYDQYATREAAHICKSALEMLVNTIHKQLRLPPDDGFDQDE